MKQKRDHSKERANKVMRNALVLSVLFHLGFMLVKFDVLDIAPEPKIAPKQIEVLDAKKVAEIKKLIKKQQKLKAKKQIVNTEKYGQDIKPVDSRFLGARNQKVDRQTIAKKVDPFKNSAKGERDGAKKVTKKKSGGKKVVKDLKPKKINLSDLGAKMLKINPKPKKAAGNDKKLGVKFGKSNTPGVASNNDYIEDIPLGDMTHLNTTEYKYFGFYSRIRSKLEQYWGNSLKEKAQQLYKKGRNLASKENYITSLNITIDSKGNIVKIHLQGSSGVSELDTAAIESFNKAGPFPNPPKGMLKNGKATIEWGFVVRS